MTKVLTERPRVRGWARSQPKGYHRQIQRDGEDGPCRESVRRKWVVSGQNKGFSDLIGPLRRFLHSKVGQPWNEVYSEIRERLSPRSLMHMHLLEHVMDYVKTHTWVENGQLYYRHSFGASLLYDPFLYVHPETGLLVRGPERSRESPAPHPDWVWGDKQALIQYRKIQGVWYHVQLADFPNPRGRDSLYIPYHQETVYIPLRVYDCIFKKEISAVNPRYYGGSYYAISKRQLNSREIRKLGLRKDWGVAQEIPS